MTIRERLSVLVSLTLAGLGFSLLISPPTVWVLVVALAAAVFIGTDGIVRSHPKIHLHSFLYSLTFCILPTLLTIGAALFLRLVVGAYWLVAGLVVAGVLLTVVILAEYYTVDLHDLYYGLARFALNLVSYLAAFALYTAIYQGRVRSAFSATAILVVTALLALELFRETEAEASKTWLYALVTGLVVAEATWALNYWAISSLAGGVFLLLVFYILCGLIQHHLVGRLTRALVVEYGAVTALGFIVLLSSRFWLR